MRKIYLILIVLCLSLSLKAQMILEFNTNLSTGTTVTLPLNGTVDISVDWGDGNTESFTSTGDKDHTYTTDGIYNVSISGTLTQFGNSWMGYDNADKIEKVTSFGEIGLTSLSGAFKFADNLTEVPSQIPSSVTDLSNTFESAENFDFDISGWDVQNVTDMNEMFRDASAFNQNIGNWDVSEVKDMTRMFYGASAFNQDISKWNVSNVNTMKAMFSSATNFNQDIGKWDVSNVTDMSWMFEEASKFDNDISNWNTSSVTKIHCMFYNAHEFNQDISNWDISNITKLTGIFFGASNFNQNISNWDVSNVTIMEAAFWGATSFNQDLSSWNVSNVTDMRNMFVNIKLSTAFYNNMLLSWSAQSLNNSISFHGGNSQYTPGDAADARQYIIDTYGWTITDGGTTNLPAVITDSISNIEFTSATSGGEVTNSAGSTITERGIVWNTTPNPTTSNNLGITSDGTGIGAFVSNLTSLNPGELYYVRAYATNSNGTDYGNTRQFIPQQELTLSGNFTAHNKVYDGNVTALINTKSLNLENIISGHEDVSLANVNIRFSNKNIGISKTVEINDVVLAGNDSLKYFVSLTGSPTTTADITVKELIISGATGSDKIYDGTANAQIKNASLVGTISGDDIYLNELTGSFSNKNVGNNKTVTSTITIAGADVGNYSLTQPTGLTADITTKELTVDGATASDKIYDRTTNAEITDASLTGTISSDDISLNEINGSFSDKNVGANKTVIPALTITGADVGNYFLTQPTGITADITPKELIVNGATASDKTYDGTLKTDITGASLTGIISGDDVSLDESVGYFSNNHAGTNKAVTAAITITGVEAGNYLLSQPTGLTADITVKELTISNASASDRIYDGTTEAEITDASLVGTISGDDISLDELTGTFSDKNVGTDKTVNAAITITGTDNENYSLTQPTGLSADITEKELTISGSYTVLDKDYDGTTSATIDNNELILEGTIENDDISMVNEVAEFSQSEVGDNITVTIISAELDGSDKTNYTLSLAGAPTTTANILSTTGVYDSPKFNVKIYPNPFVDYIRIKTNENKFHVILINIAGQKLIDQTIDGEGIINTSILESGIYFLIVQKDSFSKESFKVIKR